MGMTPAKYFPGPTPYGGSQTNPLQQAQAPMPVPQQSFMPLGTYGQQPQPAPQLPAGSNTLQPPKTKTPIGILGSLMGNNY
jgi:hypothetical protein